MSHERKRNKLLRLGVVVLTAAAILAPTVADAQRTRSTAERRQNPGAGFWANQRASRSVQHARNYSRDIYRYSRDAGTIDPAVAKAESEELGRNIAKAQKELAAASEEAGNDPNAVAALKSINERLAAAAKHHTMLHEECCKDSVDGAVCMKCCNNILLELDKAQAEQDALIRTLEIKQQPAE